MASTTAKILLPLRLSFSQSRKLFHGKIGALRTWAESIEPKLQNKVAKFEYKFLTQRKYVQEFCFSGNRNSRGVFGVSVVFGTLYCWPRFTNAMDGLDIFVDDYHIESFEAPEGEDDRRNLWILMRKLWLPVFFIFTVLVNWDNPFAVLTRTLLFLLSTKPSPSSVYLFVERLCHGYMRQNPYLYRFKSLHASKVEVQDYKILCLARVEIGDEKLRLIGILGGWWSLPSSLDLYFLAPEQYSSTSVQ